MNRKRLSLWAGALVLTCVLCVGGASAAVVDKTAPYTGDYFLAYNSLSGWSGNTRSGTMPASLLLMGLDPLRAELLPGTPHCDVIDVRAGEDGENIYRVEPRDLAGRISPPHRSFRFYEASPTLPPVYGDVRTFITIDTRTDDSKETDFILKYCGENCNIWLEKNDAHSITDEMITELGAEYDYYIHHQVQSAFGEAYDRNGDGKMAILLYDIQDGYNGASVRQYIGGFFMPADLAGDAFNNMDVLHIDTYPSITPGDLSEVKSTLVHELQHLIEESACLEADPSDPDRVCLKYAPLPTWINEGLSMAAEHMFYGTLTSRIKYYNSNSYYINIPLADWETGDTLSHYALSYLFMQYIRTQTKDFTGGGEELYKYIINSPHRSGQCIEDAMKQFYPYISLRDIFRNFYIAMILKEPTGLYGFAGETAFNAVDSRLYTKGTSQYLGAGAGLVSPMSSGSYTPSETPGSAIRYAGFKASAVSEVDAPLPSLPSGETFKFRTLTLSCAERYVTIYYTLDGSTPTPENGLIYTGKPIQLLSDTDLKAVAVTPDGRRSQVTSCSYTIAQEDVELFHRTFGMDMAIDKNRASWVDTYTSVQAPDGDIIQISSAYSHAFGGGEFSELPFPDKKAYQVLVITRYAQDGTMRWNRTFSGAWTLDAFDALATNDGFVIVGGGNNPDASAFYNDLEDISLPPLHLWPLYHRQIQLGRRYPVGGRLPRGKGRGSLLQLLLLHRHYRLPGWQLYCRRL